MSRLTASSKSFCGRIYMGGGGSSVSVCTRQLLRSINSRPATLRVVTLVRTLAGVDLCVLGQQRPVRFVSSSLTRRWRASELESLKAFSQPAYSHL